MNGLIHIYYGDGKGKTTCAIGLGVRMAGCGKKVLFAQFLKDDTSGERQSLVLLPGIILLPVPQSVKFTFHMTNQELKETAALCLTMLNRAEETVKAEECDMVILDEVFSAVSTGVLPEKALLEFIQRKPLHLELIMTGNIPSQKFLELADYISEIKKIKHPFEKGIGARRGVEY